MKLRKAVIPVAGLGTRFLPATKPCPRKCCRSSTGRWSSTSWRRRAQAGIELHLRHRPGKGVIEDHFDRRFELE